MHLQPRRHKLEPMVTLHHFAHPTWFEKLGAFEHAENIPIFVNFAETAFRYALMIYIPNDLNPQYKVAHNPSGR